MLAMGARPELWRRPLHRNKISRQAFNHASHHAAHWANRITRRARIRVARGNRKNSATGTGKIAVRMMLATAAAPDRKCNYQPTSSMATPIKCSASLTRVCRPLQKTGFNASNGADFCLSGNKYHYGKLLTRK
jgi:hypothetical protein